MSFTINREVPKMTVRFVTSEETIQKVKFEISEVIEQAEKGNYWSEGKWVTSYYCFSLRNFLHNCLPRIFLSVQEVSINTSLNNLSEDVKNNKIKAYGVVGTNCKEAVQALTLRTAAEWKQMREKFFS